MLLEEGRGAQAVAQSARDALLARGKHNMTWLSVISQLIRHCWGNVAPAGGIERQ